MTGRIIAALALAALTGCTTNSGQPEGPKQSQGQPRAEKKQADRKPAPPKQEAPKADPRPVATVSAPELVRHFKDNEADFRRLYEGRTVEVTGAVHEVRKQSRGHRYYIRFRDPAFETIEVSLLSLQCYFETAQAVSGLQPGDDVAISGEVLILDGVIKLKDCRAR